MVERSPLRGAHIVKNGTRRSRGRFPPGQPKPFERQNPKVILQQWMAWSGEKIQSSSESQCTWLLRRAAAEMKDAGTAAPKLSDRGKLGTVASTSADTPGSLVDATDSPRSEAGPSCRSNNGAADPYSTSFGRNCSSSSCTRRSAFSPRNSVARNSPVETSNAQIPPRHQLARWPLRNCSLPIPETSPPPLPA